METVRKASDASGSLSASWRPSSIDTETRTAEIVFAAGADVTRADPWTGERFVERLSVEGADLARLRTNGPLLDAHMQAGVRSQLGTVDAAWVQAGEAVARVRFSERHADVFEDVRQGIVKGASVGYQINRVRELDETVNGLPVRLIEGWTPFEVSLTPIPADVGGRVRSHQVTTAARPQEEMKMTTEERGAALVPTPTEAQAQERERCTYISTQCRQFNLGDTFERDLIDTGVPLQEAQTRVINALAARSDADEIDHHIEPSTGQRERSFAKVAGAALLHRERVEDTENPDALAWSTRSLLELARTCCEMDGVGIDSGTSKFELAKRALISSSTLADTIAHTAGRSLGLGYESVPRIFTEIFRERSAQNFRPLETIKLSDVPSLPLVAEGADYTEAALSDAKESYTLASHGSIIALTRQLVINDDVDSLTRVPTILGNAAARRENALFWGVLNGNGNMADTNPIFGAGTNNLTVGALSAPVLEAVRADMLGQVSENSLPLGLQPVWLVVGTDLLTAAEKLTRPPTDYSTSTLANTLSAQLANALQLRYEPLVPTGTYYVCADFRQLDSAEYAYLAGQSGVYLEREVDFTTGALKLKATLDFGAAAIDRRTLHRVNAT